MNARSLSLCLLLGLLGVGWCVRASAWSLPNVPRLEFTGQHTVDGEVLYDFVFRKPTGLSLFYAGFPSGAPACGIQTRNDSRVAWQDNNGAFFCGNSVDIYEMSDATGPLKLSVRPWGPWKELRKEFRVSIYYLWVYPKFDGTDPKAQTVWSEAVKP